MGSVVKHASLEAQAQLCTPKQMEEINQRFEEAASRRADLRAQLQAQQKASEQHAMFLSSLNESATSRTLVREQLDRMNTDLQGLTGQLLKDQLGVRERIQRDCVKGHGGQSRMAYRPSIEDAERQPTHVCELSHQTLAELAMLGNHCAHRERLIREIMAVDHVSWEAAHEVLAKFDEHNEKFYWLESLPYRLGIPFNIWCIVVASLMVFNRPIAAWYAENIAGEDLPDDVKAITELTTNQVGAWTWGWMEPILGTATFVLLCFQFSRCQVKKVNMKTYGEHLLRWRANRLKRAFPQYDGSMVKAWAKHMPSVNTWMPVYEKHEGTKGPCSGL